MSTRTLDPDTWQDYFDTLHTEFGAQEVEIEILDQSLGAQKQIDWTLIKGISYDPKGKMLSIAVEGIEHFIPEPKSILILEEDGGVSAIEVTGRDIAKQIIRLRAPLRLPRGT